MLLQHPHIRHHHAAIDRLAHVVHGQKAHLHRSERFHLDAGFANGFHLRPAMDAVGRLINLEIDRHARDRQWVTQRHQVARALGSHDCRDARDADHVPLFCAA